MTNLELQIPKRFYPSEFPKVGDIVMVKITEIGEDMIYCNILEYDRLGMLSYSEISRRKVRRVRQFIRVGNQEAMEVIDVNLDKGYIDLSRKQISDADTETCLAKYTAAKRMYTYFYRWSKKSAENLIEKVLWPNYRPDQNDIYGELITNQDWQEQLPTDLQKTMQEDFYKIFEKKAEKHELNVEMVCYSLEGIMALQEAVDKALQCSTDELPIECIYTGKTGKVGNIFQLSTVTKDENADEELRLVAEIMEKSISQYRSKFIIVS